MFAETITNLVVVSQEAENVVTFGRRYHWRFKILTDFQGVIDKPTFNAQGNWVYIPKRQEDEAIIPKSAYKRHTAVENAGYRVAQVIIGHEIIVIPEKPVVPPKPRREIDWGNVAEVAARGVVIGMMGVAMVSLYALLGAAQLVDPSYCIVLNDYEGTVVELIRWNVEF